MMGSAVNNAPSLDTDTKEESSDKSNDEELEDLEWSPDQEILLLYSLHGLKPVGPHKHFRMILIQERLSNAMNKYVPPALIWKKLNNWYDMEALDEAEAEADAASSVEMDFELPLEEYGGMLRQKQKGLPISLQKHNPEFETDDITETDIQKEIQIESDTSSQDHKVVSSDGESSKESDSSKGVTSPKASGKDFPKRGNKRTVTPVKENFLQKKDNLKDVAKKETPKKDESKKAQAKEEDKKEAVKKTGLDLKKDEKKDDGSKIGKKDSTSKKSLEQTKKDIEAKKLEQKKSVDTLKNQRETPKQLRTDPSKRGEAKTTRSETPKQKAEQKKEQNSDKKKEIEKRTERKSPEKTPESVRGGKLRARKEVDTEKTETPTGTKRTKESVTKASESQIDEPPVKKAKTPIVKGRPTRNSMEPQKPASPAASPQKRRTRL